MVDANLGAGRNLIWDVMDVVEVPIRRTHVRLHGGQKYYGRQQSRKLKAPLMRTPPIRLPSRRSKIEPTGSGSVRHAKIEIHQVFRSGQTERQW